jgi:hypothetical protein
MNAVLEQREGNQRIVQLVFVRGGELGVDLLLVLPVLGLLQSELAAHKKKLAHLCSEHISFLLKITFWHHNQLSTASF